MELAGKFPRLAAFDERVDCRDDEDEPAERVAESLTAKSFKNSAWNRYKTGGKIVSLIDNMLTLSIV